MIFDPLNLRDEGLIEPEQKAVDYLRRRMDESSERGILARYVYNNIAVGNLSLSDFTDALGGYSAAGIFEEDVLPLDEQEDELEQPAELDSEADDFSQETEEGAIDDTERQPEI